MHRAGEWGENVLEETEGQKRTHCEWESVRGITERSRDVLGRRHEKTASASGELGSLSLVGGAVPPD